MKAVDKMDVDVVQDCPQNRAMQLADVGQEKSMRVWKYDFSWGRHAHAVRLAGMLPFAACRSSTLPCAAAMRARSLRK